MKPYAEDIVNKLDSYTEISPSGKGLHIICQADTEMANWGYGPNVSHRNDNIGIEMYDSKRYFTITENVYREVKYIINRTSQLKEIYKKYLYKGERPTVIPSSPSVPENTIPSIPPAHNYSVSNIPISSEDKELWDRMFSSQNGQKIKSLFYGDISEYDNDDSRADLALCNYLAYWTNKNAVRMDRMFRQTKLMRAKWTRGHNPTYGERTIQTAIGQNTLQLSQLPLQQPLNVIPQGLTSTSPSTVVMNNQLLEDLSVSDYLDNIFDEDVLKFQQISGLKTGFTNIDRITSLYPGLYLLGAVPGLGKTTFATQLADNLSSSGEHVLFFSLEQKRIELVSKGISRLTVGNNTGRTAIEVRELGKSDPIVANAILKYKEISINEHFISCGFTNFDFISDKVQKYIIEKQVRPVLIVDYIQIIQPSDSSKNATKDVIDNHVREFKKLQVSNDLVLIMISSLNRANYAAPIDYESFKETGALEYTCDVIWGLQLQIMNDESVSSKKESLYEKREKIKTAKSQIPRKLEIVCIKNRFGSNYSCLFDYYAPYDLFVAQDVQNNNNYYQTLKNVPQTVAHI